MGPVRPRWARRRTPVAVETVLNPLSVGEPWKPYDSPAERHVSWFLTLDADDTGPVAR